MSLGSASPTESMGGGDGLSRLTNARARLNVSTVLSPDAGEVGQALWYWQLESLTQGIDAPVLLLTSSSCPKQDGPCP